MDMTKRLEWIDIAKGIAIILVVLGHATGASVVGKYIYCFHMPLFFIISGMCFRKGKYEFSEFFWKRFRQLFLPAIFLTSLCIIIMKVGHHPYDYSALLQGLPGALWFLPVLFCVEIVYFFSSKINTIIGGVICALIGLGLAKGQIHLPYSITSIPTALAFYSLGNLLSFSKAEKISNGLGKYGMIVCILLLVLPILRFTIYPNHLYLFANDIEWIDFIVASLASYGVLLLAMKMESCPKRIRNIMLWLGNNTMMIMAIHLPIMYIMSDFRSLYNSYILFKVSEEIAMWTISCAFALAANRYCPWIVGKKCSK